MDIPDTLQEEQPVRSSGGRLVMFEPAPEGRWFGRASGYAAAVGLLISLAATSSSRAASFDCGKARLADEIAICRDPALNDQDVRVGLLFDITLHFLAMGARDEARDRQKQWLAERSRCGSDVTCLRRAYDQRLGELQGVLERAYGLGPL